MLRKQIKYLPEVNFDELIRTDSLCFARKWGGAPKETSYKVTGGTDGRGKDSRLLGRWHTLFFTSLVVIHTSSPQTPLSLFLLFITFLYHAQMVRISMFGTSPILGIYLFSVKVFFAWENVSLNILSFDRTMKLIFTLHIRALFTTLYFYSLRSVVTRNYSIHVLQLPHNILTSYILDTP